MKITHFLEQILMENIELVCSLGFELTLISICSIRNRSRKWDVFEKPLQRNFNPFVINYAAENDRARVDENVLFVPLSCIWLTGVAINWPAELVVVTTWMSCGWPLAVVACISWVSSSSPSPCLTSSHISIVSIGSSSFSSTSVPSVLRERKKC